MIHYRLSLQVKKHGGNASHVGSKAVAAGPLLYTGAVGKGDVEEIMSLARGIKLKSKAGNLLIGSVPFQYVIVLSSMMHSMVFSLFWVICVQGGKNGKVVEADREP
jgi:hypothetical protein